MSANTIPSRFTPEHERIGRILIGYSGLEITLMNCVQVARNNDLDTVLKAMYRSRGETQRIDIADAFARHYYHGHGIGTEFEMSIGDMRHCLKIRNQFSHCLFWDDLSTKLGFADLEEIAKSHDYVTDLKGLTRRNVDVSLLQSHIDYFAHVQQSLMWLSLECRVRAGTLANKNHVAKPPPRVRPDLYSP